MDIAFHEHGGKTERSLARSSHNKVLLSSITYIIEIERNTLLERNVHFHFNHVKILVPTKFKFTKFYLI